MAYLLALHSIDGLGPIRLRRLLNYFKDPKLAWEANTAELLRLGIFRDAVSILTEKRKKLQPEDYAKKIADSGIRWVTVFDDSYPKLLKEIYNPPVLLYFKGKLDIDENAIAIVGSRKMTEQGKLNAAQFTKTLVNAGFTIISGLARGIDTQVHLTALEQGGRTVAVLGSGINNIFPPENEDLAKQIAENKGTVVSEFPPDHPVQPFNFPLRNRIISGWSSAVLVVEAKAKSGSLITARLALEQGREVFVIPPNDLIRDGAAAVFHPEEILHEMGF